MLDKYFDYKKHKTDFKTEVIAGVSTFLTMAYIMFLNPVILADGGFDFGGVFTATALAAALACFIAAFYAKTWPVGLAPGMGINAFIAYGVCLGMNYTPAEALGAVFVAGAAGISHGLVGQALLRLLCEAKRGPDGVVHRHRHLLTVRRRTNAQILLFSGATTSDRTDTELLLLFVQL